MAQNTDFKKPSLAEISRDSQWKGNPLSEAHSEIKKHHIEPMEKRIAELEMELREWYWLNHGCPSPALYGDDGEMQCSNFKVHKIWDFKRTPFNEIRKIFLEARMINMSLSQHTQ